MNLAVTSTNSQFDAYAKEQALRKEASEWDTSDVRPAGSDDIPVLDIGPWQTSRDEQTLDCLAEELRFACEEVGFFSIVGHGVSHTLLSRMFEQVAAFHARPAAEKEAIRMDQASWPHGGMGYLPLRNRKLPARESANVNEAFLLKCDHRLGMDDNRWPDPAVLPEFRSTVDEYANAMVELALGMLPIFARALEMPSNYFETAFNSPFYRLRMTRYPPTEIAEYGINPHVDTTFMTILAQDSPGLAIFSERERAWIRVPALDGALVVNTGELLRQWTNDRFVSTKHFATNNHEATARYSIPFFFNANSDYVMECIPSCWSEDNPPRYPPVSYNGSQAVAQGE